MTLGITMARRDNWHNRTTYKVVFCWLSLRRTSLGWTSSRWVSLRQFSNGCCGEDVCWYDSFCLVAPATVEASKLASRHFRLRSSCFPIFTFVASVGSRSKNKQDFATTVTKNCNSKTLQKFFDSNSSKLSKVEVFYVENDVSLGLKISRRKPSKVWREVADERSDHRRAPPLGDVSSKIFDENCQNLSRRRWNETLAGIWNMLGRWPNRFWSQ